MKRTLRLKRTYKNPCAGQKAGGTCDRCRNDVDFLFHNLGVFCRKCTMKMSETLKQHKKFVAPAHNFLKLQYCENCHRRDATMYKVNFSFCRKCVKDVAHKFKVNRDEIQTETMDRIKRYERKTSSKYLSPAEAMKKERELRKKR